MHDVFLAQVVPLTVAIICGSCVQCSELYNLQGTELYNLQGTGDSLLYCTVLLGSSNTVQYASLFVCSNQAKKKCIQVFRWIART